MAENDLIKVEGTELILESAGASLTDGSFAQADNDTVAPADNPGYPLLDFEFQGTWATATGIDDGEIRFYSRKINFEVTGDAPSPSMTYPYDLVGILELGSAGFAKSADDSIKIFTNHTLNGF